MTKQVGYSLSGCLASIARGEVALGDVAYIVTSTRYHSREDMVESLSVEIRGERATAMLANAATLWDSGRIYQPSVRPHGRRRMETLWREATPEEAGMDDPKVVVMESQGDPDETFRPDAPVEGRFRSEVFDGVMDGSVLSVGGIPLPDGPGPGKSWAVEQIAQMTRLREIVEGVDTTTYLSKIPGVGGFHGHPGIGKSVTIDTQMTATPIDDAAPASKLAVVVGKAALEKKPLDGVDDIQLTRSQSAALAVMLSGRSSIVCGVERSGRSLVAAAAAMKWDRVARGYGAENALVATLTASAASRMRSLGADAVMTYREMEDAIASDDTFLTNYGMVVLDDYSVQTAIQVDPHLYALTKLPVVRIVLEEEKLSLRTDAGLLEEIRRA